MADWGALSGLGAGLQQVGGMMMENSKAKLEEKLRQEREAREESRLINRENRQATRLETTPDPSQTRYIKNAEGVLIEQIRSSTGKVLEERLAPQDVIQDRERDEQKEKLNLEKSILDMEKTRAEIEFLPKKYGLETAEREARIGQYNAYADRARQPPAPRSGGSTVGGEARVPLDKSLEQSLLGKRDKDGNVAVDKYDRPVIDADKKAEFIRSEEYKTIPDANQALEVFIQNNKAEESTKRALRQGGIPEYALDEIDNRARAGKDFDTSKLPRMEDLSPEQRAKAERGRKAFDRAKADVLAGTVDVEEVKQQFIDMGFPALAAQFDRYIARQKKK